MKLTEKQKAFCDYYIESLNATESYKRAYGCKNNGTARTEGSKNLAKPNIKNYIDKQLKQIECKRIAKAEEVLAFLSASLRGEIDEEVVVVEGAGDGVSKTRIVTKQLSAKDRIKAAELLGKRYALFTEKVDLEANVGVTIIDDIGSLEDV
ncbi:terminase small subunit [Terrisporobacter petrolearius]|uniref:terminase small subunit n=1 Tax=Terrisporobacter petrolearius TaxID=1460447 RepID=UPI0031CC8D35